MKRSPLVAALAAAIVSFLLVGAIVLAQGPGPAAPGRPASGPNIAVIDVQYIFKNHARFKEGLSQWQAEVGAADADAKRQKDQITLRAEKLREQRPGTPEYKNEEEAINALQSEFQLNLKRKKEELIAHKAALYRQVYGEIQSVVGEIAAAYGYSLVLQFDGDKINPEKPDDVVRVVSQVVFWHAADHDITPLVLNAVNRGQAQSPTGPVGMRPQPYSVMPPPGGYK